MSLTKSVDLAQTIKNVRFTDLARAHLTPLNASIFAFLSLSASVSLLVARSAAAGPLRFATRPYALVQVPLTLQRKPHPYLTRSIGILQDGQTK